MPQVLCPALQHDSQHPAPVRPARQDNYLCLVAGRTCPAQQAGRWVAGMAVTWVPIPPASSGAAAHQRPKAGQDVPRGAPACPQAPPGGLRGCAMHGAGWAALGVLAPWTASSAQHHGHCHGHHSHHGHCQGHHGHHNHYGMATTATAVSTAATVPPGSTCCRQPPRSPTTSSTHSPGPGMRQGGGRRSRHI